MDEDEKPPDTRQCYGAKFVADYLGLVDTNALSKLMQNRAIRMFYEHFEENVVKPETAKAIAAGKSGRQRGSCFGLMEALIVSDEAGHRKYQARFPVQDRWETLDHIAYTLTSFILEFKNLMDGPLRSRQVTPHKERLMAWVFLKHISYVNCKSRKKIEALRIAKKEDKKRKRETKEAAERAEKNQGPPGKKKRKNKQSKPVAAAAEPFEGLRPEPFEGFSPEPPTAVEPSLEPELPAGPTREEIEADHNFIEHLMPDNLEEGHDDSDGEAISAALKRHNIPEELQNAIQDPATTRLTPAQSMLAERQHLELDLRDRYWQDQYIDALLAAYPDPLALARAVQEMSNAAANDVRDVEDTTWRRGLSTAAAEEELDVLGLSTTTNEDRERYRRNAKLFDNKRYQIEKVKTACKDLGIRSDARRFDVMPAAASFKFWQPSAIYAMRLFERRGLRGAILGDLMGLGKTWVMIGCFLAYNEDRKRAKENGTEIPAAKPTLVVVPPDLVEQWTREISKICGDFAIVIKYHGGFAIGQTIRKVLTRDDENFAGGEDTARTIIITSPRTLAQRHGPGPAENWRIENGYSHKEARLLRDSPPEPRGKWPQDLAGCFRYVLVDEATSIKNTKSNSHLAVKFLKPDFTVLGTGTPDQNRIDDILGLASIIEPKAKIREIEETHNVANIEGFNPYDEDQYGDDSEIGQILRLKVSNVKSFVVDAKDVATQGKRLAAFLSVCMIRRSNCSSIKKFGVIGDDIPPMTTKRIFVDWAKTTDLDEQKVYDEIAAPSLRRLVKRLPDGTFIWNFKFHRRLVLASQWTGFDKIEKNLMAKDCIELLGKDDLCGILSKMHADKNSHEAFQEDTNWQLSTLLKGSPKARALLDVVRRNVVRNQEKMIVFCQMPAQMVHYKAILDEIGIKVACYHAGLDKKQKINMVDRFNNQAQASNPDQPMVFLITIALAGVGLNLQYSCHHVLSTDPHTSQSACDQCFTRVHRIGQEKPVKAITLIGLNSFNERIQDNTLRKAAPGALASIDQNVFEFTTSEQEDGKIQLHLNDWVNHNGMLVKADDESVQGLDLEVLQGYEVLRALLNNRLGQEFNMDNIEDLRY